jgi:hypothetical protein
MKTKGLSIPFSLLLLLAPQCSSAKAAQNDNSIKSLGFVVEPPTLINLGFEWYIEGDANHNGAVQVSYRKKGDDVWKAALPPDQGDR